MEVLDIFKFTGTPINHAPWWVYASVLMTLLQTLSIASRPVACSNSGWERRVPLDKRLQILNGNLNPVIPDFHRDGRVQAILTDGDLSDTTSKNPGILKESHLPGHPLVPNALNSGIYPSSIDNDVDFVDTAIDSAFLKHWTPGNLVVAQNFLGATPWTTAMGQAVFTCNYKVQDSLPKRPPSVEMLPLAGLEVLFKAPRNGEIGKKVIWSATITNKSKQTRSCKVSQYIRRASYRGDLFEKLKHKRVFFDLSPGQTEVVSLSVNDSDYLSAIQQDNYIYGSSWVECLDTGEVAFRDSKCGMIGPDFKFAVLPNEALIKVGESAEVEVMFTNPLSVAMTGVTTRISVSGTTLGFGSENQQYQDLGDIKPGETIAFSVVADGLSPGKDSVLFTIFTQEVFPIYGNTDIDVYEDCNLNGVRDKEDLESGTSQDCNRNNIPDDCDIASNTSADINANRLPDECESDCNRNDKPDSWDLKKGIALDCNGNGIPDECDVTGVVDPPFSKDLNQNWIPDECEKD